MTKKRRNVLRAALLAMALGLMAASCANSGKDFDIYKGESNGKPYVNISRYKGKSLKPVIPSKIEGIKVTYIGAGAFDGKQITSVTIPSSVIEIGQGAFRNTTKLTNVTIPSSVIRIEQHAFASSKLTSVTIPNSVEEIGESAFFGNQLTSVTIGNSVTSIGSNAFFDNQLTNVTIPNSVKTIDGQAFFGNQLTSVTIPDSVTWIGRAAFGSLTSIRIGNDVDLGNKLFDSVWDWNTQSDKYVQKGTDPAFGKSFDDYYNKNGKKAGTYTRPNIDSTEWTVQFE